MAELEKRASANPGNTNQSGANPGAPGKLNQSGANDTRSGGAGMRGPGGRHGRGRGEFQKPKDMRKTLSKLFSYLTAYRFRLCVVALLLITSSVCTVGGSYLLKPLINNYIVPGDFAGLIQMLIFMGCVYLTGIVCSYGYARLMVDIAQNTVAKLREDLFSKMQTLPLSFFDTHTHGELMSRYTNDMENISEAINNSFGSLISCVLNFTLTITMMLILNPALSLVTFGMLIIMFFVVTKIGGASRRYFTEQQKTLGAMNGYIEEMTEGQKVIKVFRYEKAALNGFDEKNNAYQKAAVKAHIFAGIMMPAMGNLSYLNYALTCAVGALMAIHTNDLGGLAAFLQYSRQVSQPITQVSQQVNVILAAVAGAERVFEIMDTEPELDQGEIAISYSDASGWSWRKPDGNIIPLRGGVQLNHVIFGYTPNQTVLHDISLYAKPGQKIAFVGSTGAGKTTITNLINRFYEIRDGEILYDGLDIRDIQKSSLRRSLGVVLQDTHLFTGTVRDNIRYGRPDAPDAEVYAAAKLAGADQFIRRLPDGYDTILSGDGGNLSQGERQLLNIARAACADPPVLILDEATSSIDTRTEKLIEEGMDRLMRGRTVFVIAHRLSTVRNARAIMVLEHGEIIERGDHDELLKQKGRYYHLYTGQAELD